MPYYEARRAVPAYTITCCFADVGAVLRWVKDGVLGMSIGEELFGEWDKILFPDAPTYSTVTHARRIIVEFKDERLDFWDKSFKDGPPQCCLAVHYAGRIFRDTG